MQTREQQDTTTPLDITVTSEAMEVLTWRMLARQTLPMLEHPERFPLPQRRQLAHTICLLLDGSLELDDVYSEGDAEHGDEDEPGCCDSNSSGEEVG